MTYIYSWPDEDEDKIFETEKAIADEYNNYSTRDFASAKEEAARATVKHGMKVIVISPTDDLNIYALMAESVLPFALKMAAPILPRY